MTPSLPINGGSAGSTHAAAQEFTRPSTSELLSIWLFSILKSVVNLTLILSRKYGAPCPSCIVTIDNNDEIPY
ncbi:hypothetical protein GGH92_004974 [Coemansia sp. RSA 2673]|nr:hypothetical protein GGH92_004974 [Coemansia sp. RSA 2673]